MNRSTRQNMAKQTVEIVAAGSYELPGGEAVSLSAAVVACLARTRYYPHGALQRQLTEQSNQPALVGPAQMELKNETTLAGLFRLRAQHAGPIAVLNFASAKNPGGGFLSGSQAQEESLARSSALHASLSQAWDFYERNRQLESCLYTDAMIVSPDCPVFRDDEGQLLPEPVLATFITSPAPNAGAIAQNAPQEISSIEPTLQHRAELVLAAASMHACRALVLGAWGCGVFKNDPAMVANAFSRLLAPGAKWSTRFSNVVFSVLDTSPQRETWKAFQSGMKMAD